MQFFLLVEAYIGADAAGGLNVIQLYFFNLLCPGGCLLGLGGVGGKAADKLLQLGNLGFLFRIHRLQAFAGLGRGCHEVIVVARIDPQFAIVDVGHVGTYSVQKMPVV